MSGRVITITSGKGGVGKSTTTGNLGLSLALCGLNVACVDTDIGLRNLDLVLGLEELIVHTVVDVVERRATLQQSLIRCPRVPNLYLLPASQSRDKTALMEAQAIGICDALRNDFDIILVDSPAGIEHGFRNAIAAADEVIVVTTPDVSSVRDADRVIGLLTMAGLPAPKLIVNRLRPGLVRYGDMLDLPQILDLLNIDLLGIVPEEEAVIAGLNLGEPVALNRRSAAGQAFHRIAQRILGKTVPIHSFDKPSGGLARLTHLFRN